MDSWPTPWDAINRAAKGHAIDPILVAAFVQTESSNCPYVTRFEPGWKYFIDCERFAKELGTTCETEKVLQQMSWGLMQIMGSVAREHGFLRHLPQLIYADECLDVGCAFLSSLLIKHTDLNDAIASYNAGSPRRKADGTYENQGYVDTVLKNYSKVVA